MSESHRDHGKSSSISSSHNHRHGSDETTAASRKRSHLEIDHLDAKVYIGNVPTEKFTDDELVDFCKPYGKVSDIRVFKDYIFVQYHRSEDARRLIKEGQVPLTLRGNKLKILSARDVRSTSRRSSSTDRSSKRRSREPVTHRQTSTHERSSYKPSSETNGRTYRSISRSDSHRSSPDRQLPYSILSGPKNSNDVVDCQIIIVNVRQREYAEGIESRLSSHGLITSTILLREDYTLTEAVENATRLQCLFGVVVMPMHEERHTASFHILHGQTEEHRNLSLDDGIHIIVTNFRSYKQRVLSEDGNSYRNSNASMVFSESTPAYDYHREASNHTQEDISPPVLTLNDKLPLSMLLCLLADGRQLTLEEIDRVLVYLLEKKAKMLTLPPGTLPPLPAQYATSTAFNHSISTQETRPGSRSDLSPGKSSSNSVEVSSTIAEQIRQILSTNMGKSTSSTLESNTQPLLTKAALEKLPDIVKLESTTITQPKNNVQEQQTAQSNYAFPKNEALPVGVPSFNYTSPSISTTGSATPFAPANFSSFNSALKPSTSVPVPNFVSQPSSQYFYPIPTPAAYHTALNTAAAETTAAILQAYSQFNVQPTSASSIVNQQLNPQQQQIRK